MDRISIPEQIERLKVLQKIDFEIYRLNQRLAEFPKRIKVLEEAFALKKATLNQVEQEARRLQKQKSEKELELSSKEEAIKQTKAKLFSLKTNKEYSAMLKEIEGMKADCSVWEEEILKFMEEQDAVAEKIKKEKVYLQEEEATLNQEKARIGQEETGINAQLQGLLEQRKTAVSTIEARVLQQYERILKNKDGLAMVPVKDFACQGCHMTTPAQVVNEIKMAERLIVCEACARILYLEE